MRPELSSQRLWASVEALALHTEPDRPYTRRAFSPAFASGRAWLGEQFRAAGLATRIDQGGNLIGRREGTQPGKPLVIGSHSDTVSHGGRFDGIAGVLAALEVANALSDSQTRLRHPLEVIDFLAEEPTDFGISCVGSRAMAGELGAGMLNATDRDRRTLSQCLAEVGGDPAGIKHAFRGANSVAASLELHIEQGPILESAGKSVGVVTAIAGIRRLTVDVTGRADHAGTTPLHMRKDALLAAADLIPRIDMLARSIAVHDPAFVATVGRLDVIPNNSNVVPGRCTFTVDIRSRHDNLVEEFAAMVAQAIPRDTNAGMTTTVGVASSSPATMCDARVRSAILDTCAELGISHMELPSGAGHDTTYMARLGPAGMIFIPCKEGRSHAPEEFATPAQLAAGGVVLLHTLLRLDSILD
ncbi:MAG: Zn-dependent hydrolase [Pseudomonadota bacterium]